MAARRIVRIALYTLAALVVAVIVLLLALRTGWGEAQLAHLAARQAAGFVNGDVSIGRIEGNLFSSATLHDVVLSRNGAPVVSVARMSAGYDLAGLLGGGDVALDAVTLDRPVIRLTREADGELALAKLFATGKEPADPSAPSRRITISPIEIRNGLVIVGPEPGEAGGVEVPDELRDVNARLGLEQGPDGVSVAVEHLSFVGVAPALTLRDLSGDVRYEHGDLVVDGLTVETTGNQFTLDGAIRNLGALGES